MPRRKIRNRFIKEANIISKGIPTVYEQKVNRINNVVFKAS